MKLKTRISILLMSVAVLALFLTVGYGMNYAATFALENTPIENRVTYVIDAGHGGEDGGTISESGYIESKINLEIALRLNDLMHLLGMNTLMIREDDSSMHTTGSTISQRKVSDLKNRVTLVENTNSPMLISIHQNHYIDSRYSGAQVFYAPTQGSRELALNIQNTLINTVNPGSNREIKPADNIYLMQNISCPGVLIECGFLSNSAEAIKLADPDYQKKLCCVIGSVCTSYSKSLT